MVNLAGQDLEHGHAVFFLDPHGNAVVDLLRRDPADILKKETFLLDPKMKTASLGINLFNLRRCQKH